MNIVVDLNRCQGYAQCAFVAPRVFTMHGEEALLYTPAVPDDQQSNVCFVPKPRVRCRRFSSARRRAPVHAEPRDGRIVIVGASLAGLRAAETLREEGFTGSLTLIGEEPHTPYDRPPLSKQVLLGTVPADKTGLPQRREVDAQWRLGVRATGLDPVGKQVLLADGEEVPFDRLLIATGTRARPWPDPAEAALDGVFTLRTVEDAGRLAERLACRAATGPGRRCRVHRLGDRLRLPGARSRGDGRRAGPGAAGRGARRHAGCARGEVAARPRRRSALRGDGHRAGGRRPAHRRPVLRRYEGRRRCRRGGPRRGPQHRVAGGVGDSPRAREG